MSDPRPDPAEAINTAPAEFTPHLAALGLNVEGLVDRVHIAADVTEAVRDADAVRESGPENVEFKKHLFARPVREAPRHALLLSSSSEIPATAFTGELVRASTPARTPSRRLWS
ncbi:3-hydroxyacyl-CoA dehydrogenase NAD-binding domain-containing protein [Streptomyces sp. NPDC002758]